MTRVWTWHETSLDPGPGAAAELRAWLSVVFGLGGTAALDLEVAASELVVWGSSDRASDPGEVIEVSADRPPGAVHVEVSFPSGGIVPEGPIEGILDERCSAWGTEIADDRATYWFEIPIPTAAWELGAAADAELVERVVVDHRAAAALAERYDPLIRRMAARYRRGGIEGDDLEQVGREALLAAARRFDPAAGTFERYVSRTISGTFKRHVRDHGWSIRPPRGLQELVMEVRGIEREMGQRLGRTPTPAEIAQEAGRTADEIARAREAAAAYDVASLDAPRHPDAPDAAARLGGRDQALARAGRWAVVDSAIGGLPAREREIVRLRYFEDLSQRQIAESVGVSQMHVSRLLRAALATLRESVGVSDPS